MFLGVAQRAPVVLMRLPIVMCDGFDYPGFVMDGELDGYAGVGQDMDRVAVRGYGVDREDFFRHFSNLA